jgi:hypothetical protein
MAIERSARWIMRNIVYLADYFVGVLANDMRSLLDVRARSLDIIGQHIRPALVWDPPHAMTLWQMLRAVLGSRLMIELALGLGHAPDLQMTMRVSVSMTVSWRGWIILQLLALLKVLYAAIALSAIIGQATIWYSVSWILKNPEMWLLRPQF